MQKLSLGKRTIEIRFQFKQMFLKNCGVVTPIVVHSIFPLLSNGDHQELNTFLQNSILCNRFWVKRILRDKWITLYMILFCYVLVFLVWLWWPLENIWQILSFVNLPGWLTSRLTYLLKSFIIVSRTVTFGNENFPRVSYWFRTHLANVI